MATSSSALSFFLTLYSGIMSDSAQGPYMVPGIIELELGLALCKPGTIPAVLLFQSSKLEFESIFY